MRNVEQFQIGFVPQCRRDGSPLYSGPLRRWRTYWAGKMTHRECVVCGRLVALVLVALSCGCSKSYFLGETAKNPGVQLRCDAIDSNMRSCSDTLNGAFRRCVFLVNNRPLLFDIELEENWRKVRGMRCERLMPEDLTCFKIVSGKGRLLQEQLYQTTTGRIVEVQKYRRGQLFERISFERMLKGQCAYAEYWQFLHGREVRHLFFTHNEVGGTLYTSKACE